MKNKKKPIELASPVKIPITKLKNPILYNPLDYGMSTRNTGKDIAIAVLDSGCPKHCDIENLMSKNSFCEQDKDPDDSFGHSTMVSGILGAKNRLSLTGLVPDANLYFAKILDSLGKGNFNAMVAGILWSIVKKVDIILISLGSSTDYTILHDAIKKAHESGICIIAAGSFKTSSTDYPAAYDEVLSVHMGIKRKHSKRHEVFFPSKTFWTTHLNNSFTKTTGSSAAASVVAGLAAIVIREAKNQGKIISPNDVYSSLESLSIRSS